MGELSDLCISSARPACAAADYDVPNNLPPFLIIYRRRLSVDASYRHSDWRPTGGEPAPCCAGCSTRY